MQTFEYWWNTYRNQGAQGMQQMLRGAMDERDQEILELRKLLRITLRLVPEAAPSVPAPTPNIIYTNSDPPDFSRPPSLTPPAQVQMPGPLGAADGLPSDDPANQQSLALQDAELRAAEFAASPPASE